MENIKMEIKFRLLILKNIYKQVFQTKTIVSTPQSTQE